MRAISKSPATLLVVNASKFVDSFFDRHQVNAHLVFSAHRLPAVQNRKDHTYGFSGARQVCKYGHLELFVPKMRVIEGFPTN